MSRATLLVTFDTELLWDKRGQVWSAADRAALAYIRSTGFHELLAVLDEAAVPATFAIVGHLLARPEEVPETAMLSSSVSLTPFWRSWYGSLPEHFEAQQAGLYWPSLVDLLQGARQSHEIAAHSLTHCLFEESSMPEEVASMEFGCSSRILSQAFGRKPTAFVFPRNLVGHLPKLRRAGFRFYRGMDETWWNRLHGPIGRLAHLADRVLALPPAVYRCPQLPTAHGLVNVPGSMLFLARQGVRRLVPLGCRYRQAAKGVAAAVQREGIFHLWMHPIDLGYDGGVLLRTLYQVLQLMAAAVRDGKAKFATMSTVVCADA